MSRDECCMFYAEIKSIKYDFLYDGFGWDCEYQYACHMLDSELVLWIQSELGNE